ncbi:MAG: chemotaxis protein CheW [Chloroflexota bacterium]|nr:chemotaxis protein CheW [Chloroflexota bacterium]
MENQQVMEHLPDQRDLIAFRLDNQMYALPIEPIVRIIEMVTITSIPQVNNVVEGVINVHGKTIPVINLRRHFGLQEVHLQLRTPIILVQIGEQTFGLIVDEVMDVLNLSVDQVTRVTDILPEGLGEAPILQGLAHIQDETVLLLDLEHLLLPSHVQALVQAVATLNDESLPGTLSSKVSVEEISESEEVEL